MWICLYTNDGNRKLANQMQLNKLRLKVLFDIIGIKYHKKLKY